MVYYLTYRQTVDGETKQYTKQSTDLREIIRNLSIIDQLPDMFQLVEVTTYEC